MTTPLLLGAFVRRDWIIARSYYFQRALELAWSSIELILFYALGELVNQTGGAEDTIIGGDYFAFVVVGLAFSNVLQGVMATFASLVRTEQMTGSLEAMMMVPRSGQSLIVASASFGIMMALSQLMVFLLIGSLVFGMDLVLTPTSVLSSLVILALSLVMSISVGLAIASVVLIIKQASALVEIMNYGIAVLGGVYVPVALLPGPLPFLANLFPVTWALDLARGALLEGEVDMPLLSLLGMFAVLSIGLAIWVLGKALKKARRDGSLSQY